VRSKVFNPLSKETEMRLSVLLFSCATLLLAGCQTTRYELRPPASETGRLCVTQCAGNKEACRDNEVRSAHREKEDCERRTEHKLHDCLRGADSPETRRNCENKNKPSSCSAYENTERCESDYRNCYAQCGGTVTKIVEDH
jgi:hypothetical protein